MKSNETLPRAIVSISITRSNTEQDAAIYSIAAVAATYDRDKQQYVEGLTLYLRIDQDDPSPFCNSKGMDVRFWEDNVAVHNRWSYLEVKEILKGKCCIALHDALIRLSAFVKFHRDGGGILVLTDGNVGTTRAIMDAAAAFNIRLSFRMTSEVVGATTFNLINRIMDIPKFKSALTHHAVLDASNQLACAIGVLNALLNVGKDKIDMPFVSPDETLSEDIIMTAQEKSGTTKRSDRWSIGIISYAEAESFHLPLAGRTLAEDVDKVTVSMTRVVKKLHADGSTDPNPKKCITRFRDSDVTEGFYI